MPCFTLSRLRQSVRAWDLPLRRSDPHGEGSPRGRARRRIPPGPTRAAVPAPGQGASITTHRRAMPSSVPPCLVAMHASLPSRSAKTQNAEPSMSDSIVPPASGRRRGHRPRCDVCRLGQRLDRTDVRTLPRTNRHPRPATAPDMARRLNLSLIPLAFQALPGDASSVQLNPPSTVLSGLAAANRCVSLISSR